MDFIIFKLDNTQYAIELSKIKELMIYPDDITKLPNAPKEMKGFLNMRGEIVPIIDLRIKFNINNIDLYNDNTVILTIQTKDKRMVGVVVDEASNTISLNMDEMQEISSLGVTIPKEYLKGFIKTSSSSMITIMDIESIIKNIK